MLSLALFLKICDRHPASNPQVMTTGKLNFRPSAPAFSLLDPPPIDSFDEAWNTLLLCSAVTCVMTGYISLGSPFF